MARIAVDAMGGDRAPTIELEAVARALADPRAKAADLHLVVVGDRERLEPGLTALGLAGHERLTLQHASQVVTMDDAPAQVVRGKKDASMRVAFDLVKAGAADAVVSLGNSGAMLALGLFVLRRQPGVDRPGIVTTFPTLEGPCVLCDMGANVDVKPGTLAQFGVLGAVFAEVAHGKVRPKVGLLANGEEASKGTELTRAASAILAILADVAAAGAGFEYVGYVEGRDIFAGGIDVVATDGFTGNVVLKTSEGVALAVMTMLKQAFRSSTRAKIGGLLAKPALRALAQKIDYAETGGAPLLGVNGVVVIGHGSSGVVAVTNAIFQADRFVKERLTERVGKAIARVAEATLEGSGEREPQEPDGPPEP
jgi:glycerol-3-phosphate acyltransferase PlsX